MFDTIVMTYLIDDHYRISFQQDPLDPYVEVLGRVEKNLSVNVERIVNYGSDFGRCSSYIDLCPTISM